MKPTPNDTKAKQFFTAIAMTVLFILGIAVSLGLLALSNWMGLCPEKWVQFCGLVVYALFWINNLLVVVLSILSMIDWMRSTMKREPYRPIVLRPLHHLCAHR